MSKLNKLYTLYMFNLLYLTSIKLPIKYIHTEIQLYTHLNDYNKDFENTKSWRKCIEIGTLMHCL